MAQLDSLGGMEHMAWRKHIFEEGKHYRVVAEYIAELDKTYSFRIGEFLTFCQAFYSHYDGLSIFKFRAADGEERYWELHDDEPDDKWQKIFEKVDDNAA